MENVLTELGTLVFIGVFLYAVVRIMEFRRKKRESGE